MFFEVTREKEITSLVLIHDYINILVQIYVRSLHPMSGYLHINNMNYLNNAVNETNPHMREKQTLSSIQLKNLVAGNFHKIVMNISTIRAE